MNLESQFAAIRAQFPTLQQQVHGHPLVYLDSAATTLKPKVVSDRVHQFLLKEVSNIHRGAHHLGDQATLNYEKAREKVAQFLHARGSEEIVFTRGTTESVNLVAASYARHVLRAGDEILITEMEHHANIVPWQMVAEEKGAKVIAARITDRGEIDMADFEQKLSAKTKIAAFAACSNVLGTIPDAKQMIKLAHQVGARVLIDGAQIVSQEPVNVQELDCDFFVLSGHKLFAPFGIGVLYGKKEILQKMSPYQGGGSMISQVTLEKTTFNDIPFRFEAGTPDVTGAVALATAIDFVESLDFKAVHAYEQQLLTAATEGLKKLGGVTIYGEAAHKGPILSFNLQGAHPSDVGQVLDQQGVAVRAGHHCCQPLMKRLGVPGTVRASFSIYNNLSDVESLLKAVQKAQELFQ